MRVLLGLGVLAAVLPALGVKEHDFKKCSQSGFCRRGRALAQRAADAKAWKSPYAIDAGGISVQGGKAVLSAPVKSALYPDIKFGLEVRVHDDGVVRVRMDEVGGLKQRYDGAADWALVKEPVLSSASSWDVGQHKASAQLGGGAEIVVKYDPLRVTLLRDGVEQVVLNGRGLLHMEHFRTKGAEPSFEESLDGDDAQKVLKAPKPSAWFEGEEEDSYWEETWSSWTDSKPKGPESLSIDITFPNHGHVYGIPQHASPLDLPETTGPNAHYPEPYRLWNSDVFEYGADSTISLYGSIPLLHAHSATSTVAVFNALGSETFIDIEHPTEKSTRSHWIAESGVLDVFLIPGPTPVDVFKQYAGLTGTAALPSMWSLGYHQCRWNYVSSDDVRTVQKRFDEEDMPVDVFWLDIDYSPDHKYFIWKEKEFPDPIEMVNDVAAFQRKMVVIIDPHLKRSQDYPVYAEATEQGLLVRNKDGSEYEGWCWPGSSAWVDFFNPASSAWWQEKFSTIPGKAFTWTQSTTDIHIWNDMNEPSVFNGPEISMQRDNVHHGGWEHRDVHNINGMLFTNATYTGVLRRTGGTQRPFVLTRSFFAGSQRFGAMWTGDNLGTWEHMAVGLKMVLANNIAGMTFSGSDVGGFFGNPDPEMLVRWYQLGAFNPFFRAHAHIDTKRREPYLLDEPHRGIVKAVLRLRYALLPVWYTAFREASVNGVPVVRPHYVAFPQDEAGFALDDQFFVGGSGLLVKPITEAGKVDTIMYIPEDQPYYDYFSHDIYRGGKSGYVRVAAPLEKTPVLIRGGSIVPTRERPRRSASLMRADPLTLTVALDKAGSARGELYLDAGDGYDHQRGAFVWRAFTARTEGGELRLSSADLGGADPGAAVEGGALAAFDPAGNTYAREAAAIGVERVVVLGLEKKPESVRVASGAPKSGGTVEFEWTKGVGAGGAKTGGASKLVIKRPPVGVVHDWVLVIA